MEKNNSVYSCSTPSCQAQGLAEKMFSVVVAGAKSPRREAEIVIACARCAGVALRIEGTRVYPLKGTLVFLLRRAEEVEQARQRANSFYSELAQKAAPKVKPFGLPLEARGNGSDLPPRGKSRKEMARERGGARDWRREYAAAVNGSH